MSTEFFRIRISTPPMPAWPDGAWIVAVEDLIDTPALTYFGRVTFDARKENAKIFTELYGRQVLRMLQSRGAEIVPASFDEWIEFAQAHYVRVFAPKL